MDNDVASIIATAPSGSVEKKGHLITSGATSENGNTAYFYVALQTSPQLGEIVNITISSSNTNEVAYQKNLRLTILGHSNNTAVELQF